MVNTLDDIISKADADTKAATEKKVAIKVAVAHHLPQAQWTPARHVVHLAKKSAAKTKDSSTVSTLSNNLIPLTFQVTNAPDADSQADKLAKEAVKKASLQTKAGEDKNNALVANEHAMMEHESKFVGSLKTVKAHKEWLATEFAHTKANSKLRDERAEQVEKLFDMRRHADGL